MPLVLAGVVRARRGARRAQRRARRLRPHPVDRRHAGDDGRAARGLRWATEGAWIQDLPADYQWLGTGAGASIRGSSLASWRSRCRRRSTGACATLPPGAAIYATGSSREAARLAGIRRRRRDVGGVRGRRARSTGLAALLNSVRFNQIPSNTGLGLELKVIAAVVVGGTAITGGRGTVRGHAARRRAARRDRAGADVPRRERVLGARDARRHHPCRGRGRRVARPAGDCGKAAAGAAS